MRTVILLSAIIIAEAIEKTAVHEVAKLSEKATSTISWILMICIVMDMVDFLTSKIKDK